MQQQQKNKTHRERSDAHHFNLKAVKKNPLKIWLRVGFILWPIVSILFNNIPFLKKIIINKFFGRAEDIYAKVKSIRLEVWKPGFIVTGIHFNKTDAPGGHVLQSSAEEIKASLDRKSLWSGIVICDVLVHRFAFSFSKSKKTENRGDGEKKTSRKKFEMPVPVIIRQFNVTDSKVEYIDTTQKAKVDVIISNVRVRIRNLSTLPSYDELPVRAFMRANVYNGMFNAYLKANVHGEQPAFDLNAQLTGVNMVELNNFFRAYGNFDVNDGTLEFFTEVAGKDGAYKGYVKPVIFNLDIYGKEDKHEGLLHQLWEMFVGAAAAIVTNQRKDELATKIPFEGSYKPDVNIAYAIIEVLVNAFVNALKPSIDNEITIGSVKKK